ncbi:MAG TPA: beta-ketoacyl synthase N-terminal-like domain-containing protein, partial [Planctomycetia bacterium]|nr:beta-ketoacyl synthase N-terminal-like domain-containing protein [Planctomycetia bacterium]
MTKPARSEPIAIIGIGCLFPQSQGREAFWANVIGGVDSIRPVPESHWRPEDYLDPDPKAPDKVYMARGGFLDPVDFDALEHGISPNNLEATDTSQLLGLVATQEALRDAGYGPGAKEYDRRRASVILGVTGTLELVIPLGARLGHPRWKRAMLDAGVAPDVAEDAMRRISDSYVPWQENSFPGLLGNVVAGRIANRFDLGGTNSVVDAACASSLAAIHLAAMELETGRCDLAITGGVDTFNDIFMYMCFSKTPALSPSGDARPFAKNGDGTILGEGLGIVVLKRLADAQRDGDRIYATIRGMGTSSDGRGNAVYAPSVKGQVEALRSAYAAAGVSPDTIDLVEAHGTGTKVGDAVEARALAETYRASGRDGTWCAIGSVKSQIGHTKAAAGAAGIIKAALALHHRVLPPTIKVEEPAEALAPGATPFYVNTQPRPWPASPDHPRRAAVSSFGFGGSNYHCVLEEAPEAAPAEVGWDRSIEIVALSATSREALLAAVKEWTTARTWNETAERAATSRETFDPAAPCRMVVTIDRSKDDAASKFADAAAQLQRQPEKRAWELPSGVYFGSGTAPGQLAALFPGQGSQYVGMLRELACRFPAMQRTLAEADEVFASRAKAGAARLTDRIYPHPAFDAVTLQAQEDALVATDTAQPAIGATALGALAVLEEFGVKPELCAGHSYGELVALCAAEGFDGKSLHLLSLQRG